MIRILLLLLTVVWSGAALAQSTPAATTNLSKTITTGNTFQAIVVAGTHRSLTIQNNNSGNTHNCWITFGTGITAGTAAKASSILLATGQAYTRYFPYVPNNEIEATCEGTNDTIYADVQ